MNTQKNSPTYLLLKDYFRRYRILFGLFAVGEIFTCIVLLFSTDKTLFLIPFPEGEQLSDALSRVQSFFISLARLYALLVSSFVIVIFMILVTSDGDRNWRRVALALPVSRDLVATTLWAKIAVIPTLLITVAVVITAICDRSGLSSLLGFAIPARTILGSICLAGVLCLSVQSFDILSRQFIKRGNPEIRSTGAWRWQLGGLTVMVTGTFYLFGLYRVLTTWETLTHLELGILVLGLCSVPASFHFRRLRLNFEELRLADTVSRGPKQLRARAAPRRPKHTFLRSYARLARFIVFMLVACAGATSIFLLVLDRFIPIAPVGDILEFGGALLPVAFFGLPIVLSFTVTPPRRVSRCLPLRPNQLLLRFVAYPATIFVSVTACELPLVYLIGWLDVTLVVAIQFAAFGLAVFFLGLFSLASYFALFAILITTIGTFFLTGMVLRKADFITLIDGAVLSVSILSVLACILFALGLLFWYIGITRSSQAYNATMRPDQGGIVF